LMWHGELAPSWGPVNDFGFHISFQIFSQIFQISFQILSNDFGFTMSGLILPW
jgi:hypothetical protein